MYRPVNRYSIEEPLSLDMLYSADDWHLVRAPQHEVFFAAAIFQKCGVGAWTPFEEKNHKLVRANRIAGGRELRIRHRSVRYPAFFNYLFVGLSRGVEDWSVLFKTGYLRAIVAISTPQGPRPYRVSRELMIETARKQADGTFSVRGFAKRIALDIKRGDRVRVIDENHSWWGHQLRVLRVKESSALLMGDLLGKVVEIEIALDALEKAS